MRYRNRGNRLSTSTLAGRKTFDIWPYDDDRYYEPWSDVRIYHSSCPYTDRETCTDELHPGPPYRSGGPLDVRKFTTNQYEIQSKVFHKGGKYLYDGGFITSSYPSAYLDWTDPDNIPSDWGDISSYGAEAWNKFKPAKPSVDLGLALAEAREIPRMLKTTAKGFSDLWRSMGGSPTGFGPKSLANHWLNTQFGWLPFISDLQDFYNTCNSLDKRMKQLRRDNGKWIRRGGVVLSDESSEVIREETDYIGLSPALTTYHYDRTTAMGYGTLKVTDYKSQQIWFSGAFRYWIPGNDSSFLWKGRAIATLFGLNPSPSLLYNLTPWSWLLDWSSNMGDVISNLSDMAYNNLAAKYAYIMGTTTQRVEATGDVILLHARPTVTSFAEITRKQRVEAEALGFSPSSDSYTARQWSILAALGITRYRSYR